MIENNPFQTGNYHDNFARRYTRPRMGWLHEKILREHYEQDSQILKNQNWQNPLEIERPNVLQMGVASSSTANTFVDFVHTINPDARITIADFSKYPLEECKENGLGDSSKVNLVRVDTTNLGFGDNSFDYIETDGLLQFLSPEQKRQAIAEWYRVLKPGGIFASRDRFVSIQAHPSKWDTLNRVRNEFSERLGVNTYVTTREVMSYLFTSQGFDTVINPKDFSKTLLHEVMARKPDSTKI